MKNILEYNRQKIAFSLNHFPYQDVIHKINIQIRICIHICKYYKFISAYMDVENYALKRHYFGIVSIRLL